MTQQALRTPALLEKEVRLSQCMIVKNEEANIERALGWARNRAFEQIVVDTGSTDRTVELAEALGAKVYHFEWIDDFSAAKNYAIEQAKGNWIAFLDADEWFPEEDAEKLMSFLDKLHNSQKFSEANIVTFPLVNLDNEMKPFRVFRQGRVFRNQPDLRYTGAIHERLRAYSPKSLEVTDICIYHTGYRQSVYQSTGKAMRNIEMIKKEMEENPEDMLLKIYLADSLDANGTTEGHEEAMRLFAEVADSDVPLPSDMLISTYVKLVSKVFRDADYAKAEEYCRKGIARLPSYADLYVLLGDILCESAHLDEAWEAYKKCEALLLTEYKGGDYVATKLPALYSSLCGTAHRLGDLHSTVKYATLVLKEDKRYPNIVKPLMQVLKNDGGASDDEILEFLSKLYDLGDTREKIYLARAANAGGLAGLREKIMSLITPEEQALMSMSEQKAEREELRVEG